MLSRKKSSRKYRTRSNKKRSTSNRFQKWISRQPSIKPYLSVGDLVMCNKHKEKVKVLKVLTIFKDGGTLVLSCGCRIGRLDFVNDFVSKNMKLICYTKVENLFKSLIKNEDNFNWDKDSMRLLDLAIESNSLNC